MEWVGEPRLSEGVIERDWALQVDSRRVPGTIWQPASQHEPRPLVLLGYGGGGHRRDGSRVRQGEWYAKRGIAAFSIDILGHGERALPDGRPDYGPLLDGIIAEWVAALNELLAVLPIDQTRIGYRGVSMGTELGLPLVVAESRIKAALLGLAGLVDVPGLFSGKVKRFERDAPLMRCPVLFVMNWDDEIVPRDSALKLFDAIGSEAKELRAYPGGHGFAPPGSTEAAMVFLAEQLQAP